MGLLGRWWGLHVTGSSLQRNPVLGFIGGSEPDLKTFWGTKLKITSLNSMKYLTIVVLHFVFTELKPHF